MTLLTVLACSAAGVILLLALLWAAVMNPWSVRSLANQVRREAERREAYALATHEARMQRLARQARREGHLRETGDDLAEWRRVMAEEGER